MEEKQAVEKQNKQVVLIGLAIVVGLFLLIQFLPVGISHDNPPVLAEPKWDSEQTRQLIVNSCYDCHSNETVWPWYSNIAPMSWMVEKDVEDGRKALNFSEWSAEARSGFETEEAVELVSKGEMPLPYYEILHPEARLSNNEQGLLINGIIATFTDPGGLESDDLNQSDE